MDGLVLPDRVPDPDPATLHQPRILCLHGGGTNARIFHTQCRGLAFRLQHAQQPGGGFRLVFAEAALASGAGPDVLSVYAACGPFKRWTASGPDAPVAAAGDEWAAVERSVRAAVRADAGVGRWVGVLGFSQGAKVAASVLLRQQEEGRSILGEGEEFKFGVLMAGRGPLLPPEEEEVRVLRVPTVHVHGLRDPGLEAHRGLLREWCDARTARVVEWEGDHRLPIKTADVGLVVDAIMALGREFGLGFGAAEEA